jgi:hypothetical protein
LAIAIIDAADAALFSDKIGLTSASHNHSWTPIKGMLVVPTHKFFNNNKNASGGFIHFEFLTSEIGSSLGQIYAKILSKPCAVFEVATRFGRVALWFTS